jgi:hypothetical protein
MKITGNFFTFHGEQKYTADEKIFTRVKKAEGFIWYYKSNLNNSRVCKEEKKIRIYMYRSVPLCTLQFPVYF